jgi:amino acid adenylation domain-containing protein
LVVDEIDLQTVVAFEQDERIAALWNNSHQRPLDFSESLRVTLIALSPARHSVLVSLSAMCGDLPTVESLAHEIGQTYTAPDGASSPATTAQYGDLAVWQNELLEDQELHVGREYWSKLDLKSAAASKLPFRQETLSQHEFLVQGFSSRLTRDQVLRIRLAAETSGSSVSSFLLACWGVLLGRSSGASDITVGVACDGRKYEELKNAVGPLTKFMPVVLSCPDNTSFASVVAAAEHAIAANRQWQECFCWQHAASEFSTPVFGFEHVPGFQCWAAGELSFRIEKTWSCIDRFAISLCCCEQEDELVMQIQYDAHHFRSDEIRLLAERLHTILESAARRPEALVSDLEIIGPAERRQVLVECNTVAPHTLPELCIPELFEQQVELTPSAPAIVTTEGCLSYRELNQRANQLARYLQRHGVQVESRVAILMERSLDMLVAVMAVLKAGGAYVPLDSQHPAERISYVLADAAPAALLTHRRLAANLPVFPAKTISIDEIKELIAQESEANASVPINPDCLAYLIYTSGSTGLPKGSMIPHRALVNHALQMVDLYDLKPGRRMLQFFSLSFDASAEDIFPTLLSGATLVCPFDFFSYSPSELLAFCRRFEVSTLHLPVVLWHQLVEELSSGDLSLPQHIRMLSVGGESPAMGKLATWSRITSGDVAFRNMYGPTEATITASVYRQDDQTPLPENRAHVPIGRSLANVPIYLLDANMQPVPVGVQGEIYIGGVALARGYANQPGLTAEKFVPDPFSERAGARLYRTGDLAQRSIEGEMDFLGRIDHQVKIRGFRVELGEIERILVEHPAIKDAVVTVHQNGTGEKKLAAYITLRPDQSTTAKQMRSHLRERLPEYMFPSWFVVLNSLPLTSTGKVDRKSLPAPTSESLGPEQEYVAPRNPTEEIVAAVFAEVLQTDRIGILDNFFESGGHSLLATQLASRLREIFQVEVPLRRIFEDPTVAGVAAALLEEEGERLRVQRTAELMIKLAAVSDDQAESMLEKPLGR